MILGVCGSPRKGATEHVLREALKTLRAEGFQTEFFSVRGRKIGFCQHCDYCLTNKRCVIDDDMFKLYPLLKKASGYVFATPVYNGGISAQCKTIMDRCRALLAENPDVFRYKAGAAIAVGGDRAGGQELAMQQIVTFYVLNGVIPVSGGFFGANLGASFWSKDTLDDVKRDKEGMRSMEKTLKKFIKLYKRLEHTRHEPEV